MTAQDLLFTLLRDGWSWGPSEIQGYMLLTRGEFKWQIDPFNLNFESLIRAIEVEAYERGKREAIK